MYDIISSEMLYSGRVIGLCIDTVNHRSGKLKLEVVKHSGGVAVVALNDKLEVALVRQYRHPIGQYLLELPAGRLEAGDTPLEGARRELQQETGLIAADWKLLAKTYPAPGYCQELLHIFLARQLTSHTATPDEDEEIEVVYLPLQVATKMCYSGELVDAKTIIGLLTAENFLKDKHE
ncbi:MAG: NUDIX hydrolase [Acidobacteriota bacterium]|nr:NUDIX hydrolase [Blastocatellia bacterium]MDW8413764.1 NUDIX hydrolase [Acidobacteriota bacterium]